MERGQTAWLGDVEPINFPLQPISHVLSLCPFLLMTHFLCPSAHFQAKSEKESLGVCICPRVCVCQSETERERKSTHLGVVRGERRQRRQEAGFCQSFLSQECEQGAEEQGGGKQSRRPLR